MKSKEDWIIDILIMVMVIAFTVAVIPQMH